MSLDSSQYLVKQRFVYIWNQVCNIQLKCKASKKSFGIPRSLTGATWFTHLLRINNYPEILLINTVSEYKVKTLEVDRAYIGETTKLHHDAIANFESWRELENRKDKGTHCVRSRKHTPKEWIENWKDCLGQSSIENGGEGLCSSPMGNRRR